MFVAILKNKQNPLYAWIVADGTWFLRLERAEFYAYTPRSLREAYSLCIESLSRGVVLALNRSELFFLFGLLHKFLAFSKPKGLALTKLMDLANETYLT